MTHCRGCEALPAIPESGRLYVGLPRAHTRAVFCAGLDEAGIRHDVHDDTLISLDVAPHVLRQLAAEARRQLSCMELAEARCLLLPQGAEPAPADLMRTTSLTQLVGRVEGRWLVELLDEGRLVTYFQPIVDSREAERVFAYECLVQGEQPDGQLIYPDRLYGAARESNLLCQLDLAARLRAIASATEYGLSTKVFINVDPSSVYDPEFCLQSTVEAAEQSLLAKEQFVFELSQIDRIQDERHLRRILEYFRRAGFEAALNGVGFGYRSLNLLSKLKPEYVKLDMELIRDADHDPFKAQIAAKALEMARGVGSETIAKGVETEAEWQWLRDHGARYAQGYFFGRPARAPRLPLGLSSSG